MPEEPTSWPSRPVPFAAQQPSAGGPWAPAGPWAPSADAPDGEAAAPEATGPAPPSAAEAPAADVTPQEPEPYGPYAGRLTPAAGRAGLRGRLAARTAGMSLRTRLLAAILGLMALVTVVIGVVSVLALRSYLVGQLDQKVVATRDPSLQALRSGGPRGSLGFNLGQAPDTFLAGIVDGEVVGQPVVLTAGGQRRFPSVPARALTGLPVDKQGHTRDLGPDVGRYRLIATEFEDGSVLVTGLPMAGVSDTSLRLAGIITLVAVAGLGAAGVAGAAIVRMQLRPLNRVAATARKVSTLPLDRGEVALAVRVPEEDTDPRTEVGQVGAALNAMLGHVDAALTARQASETRIRRFVADASHELRTPLAAIRGYAELSRRSQETVPDDVAHAMARVESQAVRMTGLVEDLLLLASLDSGRPLELAPVDLSMLLVGAVSDAHAAGPGHIWRLDLPDEPVTAVGEAARLTQVVVNLLANARAHTPPGTTVTAGLAVDGPSAVVTVLDDGPGIPAQLLPEVFERFARGDSSRSRAAGSTGLGLSIVSAVVAAHHGTVAVESRPGRTLFTVRLPLSGPLALDAPAQPGP